ncbi:hypothetical protein [Ectobacillus ponti]|uniref:DUF4363 domain-containing protein n=1 Tax=Ectobacillus ponti TaxID=2961894 RepID=A0AA41XBD9_9BACI|nr:hypothetical protein [Ectobacillus ponti]MCP8970370.1 hypothetical protein [Ectobacillus ponti]
MTYVRALLVLAVCVMVSGCAFGGQEQEQVQPVNQTAPAGIKSGVEDVLQELKKLQAAMKQEPRQQDIQQFGKALATKWDAFEGDVEKSYPAQYETIEKNLYPLIAETGKSPLDLQKIQTLVENVQRDLSKFLEQLQ